MTSRDPSADLLRRMGIGHLWNRVELVRSLCAPPSAIRVWQNQLEFVRSLCASPPAVRALQDIASSLVAAPLTAVASVHPLAFMSPDPAAFLLCGNGGRSPSSGDAPAGPWLQGPSRPRAEEGGTPIEGGSLR